MSTSTTNSPEKLRELATRARLMEQEGNFYQAQLLLDKMKELNIREGKEIETLLKRQQSIERQEIMERERIELDTFAKVWEERLEEYERQARDIVQDIVQRQQTEYQTQDETLKRQLLNKRPKFSKSVLHMRSQLEKLVKLKLYADAEIVRNQLQEQELVEIRQFENSLSVTFDKKMEQFRQQHVQEIHALKQRIESGRDALLAQRKLDWERLLRHHQNKAQELEVQHKRDLSRTVNFIQRQSAVLLTSPRKANVDYNGLLMQTGSTRAAASSPYSSNITL